jgi:hypothetical protein
MTTDNHEKIQEPRVENKRYTYMYMKVQSHSNSNYCRKVVCMYNARGRGVSQRSTTKVQQKRTKLQKKDEDESERMRDFQRVKIQKNRF